MAPVAETRSAIRSFPNSAIAFPRDWKEPTASVRVRFRSCHSLRDRSSGEVCASFALRLAISFSRRRICAASSAVSSLPVALVALAEASRISSCAVRRSRVAPAMALHQATKSSLRRAKVSSLCSSASCAWRCSSATCASVMPWRRVFSPLAGLVSYRSASFWAYSRRMRRRAYW